ncbi:hypothetical protein F2Q68_00033567 [Brassica cretica]|uniref:Uncharacterized protein n=1 Tax=Brassica cretica TaxID=69181 RepID=A0A8S9H561_BRACR|nr:hypothetical protein F2Q68_00033567 [Brassica cretica]
MLIRSRKATPSSLIANKQPHKKRKMGRPITLTVPPAALSVSCSTHSYDTRIPVFSHCNTSESNTLKTINQERLMATGSARSARQLRMAICKEKKRARSAGSSSASAEFDITQQQLLPAGQKDHVKMISRHMTSGNWSHVHPVKHCYGMLKHLEFRQTEIASISVFVVREVV